jgi:hypothetical protein
MLALDCRAPAAQSYLGFLFTELRDQVGEHEGSGG